MRSRSWGWGFRTCAGKALGVGLCAVALPAVAGCASGEDGFKTETASAPAATAAGAVEVFKSPSAEAPAAPPAREGQAAESVPPTIARKIIYNARLTVVVESVTATGEQIARLVTEAGGYVSGTDQSSYTHTQRSSSWTVRVPVEKFDAFVAGLSRLGEVQQSHVDSQDVTQEYYDTEARIGNKQKEEKRLQKHLDDSTGKLDDILAVERELSRVRGEIESMQGRIRFLANLSSLSTVTIIATEVRDFTPPVSASFATRVARTFGRSVENLVGFCGGVVLAGVAVAPWLPILALLALPVVALRRLVRRRARVVLTPTDAGP